MTALSDRLAELQITPVELAGILDGRYDVEMIRDWINGATEPDADARVRLRFLDSDAAAIAAVERVRTRITRNLTGEGAEHAGVSPPYGTHDTEKTTGGSPK